MTSMKGLAMMYAMSAMIGDPILIDNSPKLNGKRKTLADVLNDGRLKGKGFSGGESKMREFAINGVTIKATDLKMAKKKYTAMKNTK